MLKETLIGLNNQLAKEETTLHLKVIDVAYFIDSTNLSDPVMNLIINIKDPYDVLKEQNHRNKKYDKIIDPKATHNFGSDAK